MDGRSQPGEWSKHIGSVELAENEQIGKNRFRFFVLDESALVEGSPNQAPRPIRR